MYSLQDSRRSQRKNKEPSAITVINLPDEQQRMNNQEKDVEPLASSTDRPKATTTIGHLSFWFTSVLRGTERIDWGLLGHRHACSQQHHTARAGCVLRLSCLPLVLHFFLLPVLKRTKERTKDLVIPNERRKSRAARQAAGRRRPRRKKWRGREGEAGRLGEKQTHI